jgi:hypothetical protein
MEAVFTIGASALLLHLQEFLLHAEPNTGQVDGDYLVERFFRPLRRHLAGRPDIGTRDTGVVESAVQPAVGGHHFADHGGDLDASRDVRLHEHRLPASCLDKADRLLRDRFHDVAHRHAGALAGHGKSGRAPDPTASAGDQGRPAVEHPWHGSSAGSVQSLSTLSMVIGSSRMRLPVA